MSTDLAHRLIAEARREHVMYKDVLQLVRHRHPRYCRADKRPFPCLTIQLAEELERVLEAK